MILTTPPKVKSKIPSYVPLQTVQFLFETFFCGCVPKLPVLKIYNIRNVNYRFSTLAINFRTQPVPYFQEILIHYLKWDTLYIIYIYIGLMQKFVPFLALDDIASQNRSVVYFTCFNVVSQKEFFRSESLEFYAYHFQLAPIFRCHQSRPIVHNVHR